jgi:hypothetical protein
MQEMDDRMKEILELTLAIQSKNANYEGNKIPGAHLASPVTEVDLLKLKRHLARLEANIPPSFIQFLSITDGIEGYMQLQSLSLRSAKEIVESQQSDCQWDDFAPLHEFVIASGDTGAFIAFDRSRASPSGEMPVVWIDESGNRTEFSDFYKFLQEQLQFQKDVLAMNEADRANLQEV